MLENGALTPAIIVSFVLPALAAILVLACLVANRRRYVLAAQIALPLALVAMLGSFAAYRFRYAGLWLPTLPDNVGNWTAAETPITPHTLALLGNPMADGHEYHGPFGEVVYSTAVCAGPFENYHDPTVCVPDNGFQLTAKKTMPMGIDNWKVRAMIFKKVGSDQDIRIMMYYWTQTRLGHTATEARMGNFQDVAARMQTGYAAVVEGEQNVILRIYTVIPPDDPDGAQAQHNLNEVCRATYRSLRDQGVSSK